MKLVVIEDNSRSHALRVINAFNEDSYVNFKRFIELKVVVNSSESLYSFVIMNFRELQHQVLDSMQDDMMLGSGKWNSIYRSMGVLNGRTLNILSSIRSYHDILKTNITRIAGDAEYQELRQPFIKAFDGDKFYRIGEKYRNYVQHCGLPGEKISMGASLIDRKERKSINSVVLYAKKTELLNNFDWGSVCNNDIAGLPEEIDVIELIGKYLSSFIRARQEFVGLFKGKYVIELEILERLSGDNHGVLRFVDSAIIGEWSIGCELPHDTECVEYTLGTQLFRNFRIHETENITLYDPARHFFSFFPKSEGVQDRLLK